MSSRNSNRNEVTEQNGELIGIDGFIDLLVKGGAEIEDQIESPLENGGRRYSIIFSNKGTKFQVVFTLTNEKKVFKKLYKEIKGGRFVPVDLERDENDDEEDRFTNM